jgi:UDP-N-acetylmuramoyl-L-alanyl-D-glutamate--2,6-diaminopimelate ligase
MRLTDLLSEIAGSTIEGRGATEVTAAVHDSRRSAPGIIFVAVPGLKADGHDYLRQAISAGAMR